MGTLLLLSFLAVHPGSLPSREIHAQPPVNEPGPSVEATAPPAPVPPPEAAPTPAPATGQTPTEPGAPATGAKPPAKPSGKKAEAGKSINIGDLPWKLASKISASVFYGVWILLWAVSIPFAAVGGALLSLSAQPSMSANSTGFIAGGGVLVAAAVVGLALGLLCAGVGSALGVTATVLAHLQPGDTPAAAQISLLAIPRQLFL